MFRRGLVDIMKFHDAEGNSSGGGMNSIMNSYLEEEETEEVQEKDGTLEKEDETEAEEEEEVSDETGEKSIEGDLEKLTSEELIAEIKTRDNKISSNDKQLQEYLATIKTFEEKGADSKYKQFIEDFKKNPKQAVKKYSDEFKLPSDDSISAIFSKGTVEDRLAVWQEKILPGIIEKEFNMQEGEFEIIPADAYKAKTPTARWIQLTKEQEAEYRAEDAEKLNQGTVSKEKIEAYQERQKSDLAEIGITFFNGGQKEDTPEAIELNVKATSEVESMVQEMNAIPEKIIKGELKQSSHPFEMGNLIKGVFFDKLSDIKVEKAVNDVLNQLRKKGIQIPTDTPTDLSSINAKEKKPKKKKPDHYSPMYNAMSNFT